MTGTYATHPKGAPGSPQAVANGCACPTTDNGAGLDGGLYWIQRDCPLHDNARDTMALYDHHNQ